MRFLVIFLLSCMMLFGVDINSASEKELTQLKGVGKVKAKAIVEYRKGHCFKDMADLASVKGIGVKTIEKNKQNISVGRCR